MPPKQRKAAGRRRHKAMGNVRASASTHTSGKRKQNILGTQCKRAVPRTDEGDAAASTEANPTVAQTQNLPVAQPLHEPVPSHQQHQLRTINFMRTRTNCCRTRKQEDKDYYE